MNDSNDKCIGTINKKLSFLILDLDFFHLNISVYLIIKHTNYIIRKVSMNEYEVSI